MNYETSISADMNDAGRQADAAHAGVASGYMEVGRTGGGWSRGRVLLVVALVLLALGGAYYLKHRNAAATASAEQGGAQAQTVTVITPGMTSVQGTIVASGTIAARREMPVGVAGEGGKVASVLVDAGDWVQAGQVLAVIDRSVQAQQVESQAANVEVAAANARIAQSNLDRALKLVDKGFISKADVDRLTATRDRQWRVRVAQATLGQLRASTARLNILAPEAGLVLTRGVEPGQVVSSGSGVLFRIAKGGELEMQARLAEADMAKLSVGVSADVTPVGTATPFTGQIWQLAPTIDATTREGIARSRCRTTMRCGPAVSPARRSQRHRHRADAARIGDPQRSERRLRLCREQG
jgi:RND family efflux transporter MFP subunit